MTLRRYLLTTILPVLVLLLVLAGVVFAQDAGVAASVPPDPAVDLGGFFSELYHGVRSGNWLVVGALALSGITYVVRKLLAPRVEWFKTDEGGVTLVFGTSLLLGLANALWVHAAFDLKFVGAVLLTAVTAAGGYSAVKRVGGKLLSWIIGKFKG